MDAAHLISQAKHRCRFFVPAWRWLRSGGAWNLPAIAMLVALVAVAVGCNATPRTRITPASTQAESRLERPGITETLTITIDRAPQAQRAAATTPVGAGSEAAKKGDRPSAEQDQAVTPQPLRDIVDAATRGGDPDGGSVRIEYSRTIPLSTEQRSLADTGPGLDARGEGQATTLNQRDRRLSLPWDGEAHGGGWGLDSEFVGGSGVNWLHIIGGVFLLLAVIPLLLTPKRFDIAAVIGVVGLTVIAAGTVSEQYPWIFALVLLAVIGAIVYLVLVGRSDARKRVAIEAVATGVQNQAKANPEQSAKPSIADAAKAAGTKGIVDAVIDRAKHRLGL